jgi:ligand-binding sensor domain-containing protein
LIIGGVGVLGLIGLAILGGLAIVSLPLAGSAKPTSASTSATATTRGEETVEPTQATGSVGSPGWTSWTSGNTIYSVVVNQDQLLTGGPGSLTVWDAEGSVLRRLTSGNGLPDPTVTAIFVDTDGTWWIGTDYGLVHLDGENWLAHYTTDDGLDSVNIRSITRAGDNLVVGTSYGPDGGGVNFFDGKQWTRAPNFPSTVEGENPEALSNNVNVILADGPDELWVGTENGLGYFDGETWTRFSMEDGLPANRIYTLMFDQNDELWVGTDSGAAHFVDQTFETSPQGPPYGVYGMLQDQQGAYWFSGGGGIWKFDLDQANWTEYSQQTGDLPVYTTFGAAQDENGNLYFASDGNGLLRWDGGSFTPWMVTNIPTVPAFGRILSAPDGQLWFVQEYGSYIDRFDLGQETWSPVTNLPCSCSPLAFDSSGNLWAAEYNGGFWIIGKDDASHITAAQGLREEVQVTQIAFAQDGTPWIGTDQGVAFFDGKKITEILNADNTGFASDFVRSLFPASDGSMWVGLQGGLSRMKPDGTWEHFAVDNPFTSNFTDVYDMAEDANGVLWVATYGDGVYRFADEKWERFLPDDPGVQLPSTQVNSVAVAPDGSLWFGTYYSGAARYDGNEWRTFDDSDGLINYNVNDIFVEPNGVVWFATSGGVTRYIP